VARFIEKLATKKNPAADKETEQINKNKEKPENKKRHKFQAAEWTHPNGHPRCKRCGDEERVGGICKPTEARRVNARFLTVDELKSYGPSKAEIAVAGNVEGGGLFVKGDRVRCAKADMHATFGFGVVSWTNPKDGAVEVMFDKGSGGMFNSYMIAHAA